VARGDVDDLQQRVAPAAAVDRSHPYRRSGPPISDTPIRGSDESTCRVDECGMLVPVIVRPLEAHDRPWLHDQLVRRWGLPVVSVSGAHDPSAYPGFVAEEEGRTLGVATYRTTGNDCELITLDAMERNRGVGTRLLAAVKSVADGSACRLWLITTNENIDAIRFYQRRGMDLRALHRDFDQLVRRHKPSTSEAIDGIAVRHALEFSY
jgi:GNAT superfamily N-acetyltransferase